MSKEKKIVYSIALKMTPAMQRYPSLFCLLIFLLISCNKEDQLAIAALDREEAAHHFLLNTPSLILFGSLTIDHETERVHGWVVDKHAQLRSVDLEGLDALVNLAPSNALESGKLYSSSAIVSQIDQVQLAKHYKFSLRQTPDAVHFEKVPTMTTSSVIVSFQPISSTYSPALNECTGDMTDSENHMNGFQYNRKVWSAHGHYNLTTGHAEGMEIVDWMQGLVREVESE